MNRNIQVQLRVFRAVKGWTQVQVAKKAKIHINTYRCWELGRHEPSFEGLYKLAKLYQPNSKEEFITNIKSCQAHLKWPDKSGG